jgi:hypothetical protein
LLLRDRAQIALAVDEPHAHDLGGDRAELQTGAVGTRGESAGEGLLRYRAEVLKAKFPVAQFLDEVLEPDAAGHCHAAAIDRDRALHVVEREEGVIRGKELRERVTCALRPHVRLRRCSVLDDPDHVCLGSRAAKAAWPELNRVGPVLELMRGIAGDAIDGPEDRLRYIYGTGAAGPTDQAGRDGKAGLMHEMTAPQWHGHPPRRDISA